MSTTYRKTIKGVTEIETRAFRLTPRLRNLLILLDGKLTLDGLRPLISQGLDEGLQVLLQGGFIEAAVVPEPIHPAARPTTAAHPAPPEPASADFLAVRQAVVRMVNEQLGPAAESVAIRIERAANAAELQPLLATAARLVHQVRGAQAAQAFRARFLAE